MRLGVYVCVAVQGLYTYKTEYFDNVIFLNACVVVEGMYTCKTQNFGNQSFCLCLFCYRGCVYI